MYKVTFEGLERTHESLLAALEHRKHIIDLCPQASHLIFVWEHADYSKAVNDPTAWEPFDTEGFLNDLALLMGEILEDVTD